MGSNHGLNGCDGFARGVWSAALLLRWLLRHEEHELQQIFRIRKPGIEELGFRNRR